MRPPHVAEYYVWFGKRVRLHRDRLGLTQTDVANRLFPPVTRAHVANIESAKSQVLAHTVCQLARILKIKPAVLIGGGR